MLDWLFGAGVGTNLGAAVIWLPVGALLGWLWARAKFEALHRSHRELHAKLDALRAPEES